MIFFDLDNTLLDHDGAEQDAIRDFPSVTVMKLLIAQKVSK